MNLPICKNLPIPSENAGRQVAPTFPLIGAHSNLANSNLAHSNLAHSNLAGVGWGGGMGRVCLRDNGPPLHYYPVQSSNNRFPPGRPKGRVGDLKRRGCEGRVPPPAQPWRLPVSPQTQPPHIPASLIRIGEIAPTKDGDPLLG